MSCRLHPEQHSLGHQSSRIARQGTVAAYDAMTRNQDADAVSAYGFCYGSYGFGLADALGYFLIALCCSVRNS